MGTIITIILIIVAASSVYMVACISRFKFMLTLAGKRKWVGWLASAGLILLCLLVLSVIFSTVNALVIFLHLVAFFLIVGGILRLVGHFMKKKFNPNLQGLLAVAFAAIYLFIGWISLHHVWQADYNLTTDKDVNLKVAMIADSHLGTSFDGAGFAKHMETIQKQQPDFLVIAGDFVDDSTKREDMIAACEALGKMNLKYGVFYVYGNHDRGYFNGRDFSAEDMEAEFAKNGIRVLKDDVILVDDSFYLVGRKDRSMRERKEIAELLENADTSKYIIVADHQPADYENQADSPADLVLSGHTHGGWMFPVNIISNLLNIDDKTYGHETINGTDFIVTSGISDWELKFRTGTRSEYVIVNIKDQP